MGVALDNALFGVYGRGRGSFLSFFIPLALLYRERYSALSESWGYMGWKWRIPNYQGKKSKNKELKMTSAL